MEFWQEILCAALQKEKSDSLEKEDIRRILDSACYEALLKIKKTVEDDSLNDMECFIKIEKIVCILEDIGSDGGSRHDFG